MALPRFLLLLAVPALSAGCLYDFKNPAEVLRAGEASGTVLAERAGPGQLEPFEGVSVSLKGSGFDQTTRVTGRFALVDLPVGRHTLLFRKGTTWSLERDVELGFGQDGQPEGVDLGQVVLRYASPVEGTVLLPSLVQLDGGVAVDETSGQTASIEPIAPGSNVGRFRFPAMAPGTHVVKVAARDLLVGGTWVSDQLGVVTIAETSAGEVRTLAPMTLRGAAASGRIRFRVQLVGNPGVTMADVTVTLVPDPGLGPVVPDSQGFVDVQVAEGLYQVTVTSPPVLPRVSAPVTSLATVTLPGLPVDPQGVYGVVLGSKVAEVGSVYVVSDLVVAFSSRECRAVADCGTSFSQASSFLCSSAQCFVCFGGTGGPDSCTPTTPLPGPSAAIPFCAACDARQTASGCQFGPGITGFCNAEGFCQSACSATTFSCTPDGVQTYTSGPSGC